MSLSIEFMALSEIKEYAGNAKNHPEEQVDLIAKSITEYGFNDPIAIWGADNEIVEGHGRFLAAKKLNLEVVPVIRLDELTDEQRRAYGLVHNKLTMDSGFDLDALSAELSALSDLDMSEFGFEDVTDVEDLDDDDKVFGGERMRTNNAYNLELVRDADLSEDFWQMPIIKATDYIPRDLIGFNYAKTSTEFNKGVHFFVDDYQFERIWNMPERYVEILGRFDCVLSPDFSLYMDMPIPMMIWNIYRSRMMENYWQREGLEVIPTVSWGGEETFCFAFEGLEQGGVKAVSTVGVKNDKEARRIWCQGMDAAIERLSPDVILLYGGAIDYDFGKIKVVEYVNSVTERMGAAK